MSLLIGVTAGAGPRGDVAEALLSTAPVSSRLPAGAPGSSGSAETAAPVSSEPPAAAPGTGEPAPQQPDQASAVPADLPDDGPRYEQPVKGPGAAIFQNGLTAYAAKNHGEAGAAFFTIVEKHPRSPLADAARAFLAELQITDAPTPQTRQLAIDAYRRLIRDFPGSPNAARAYWRIGDLYVAMNMRAEAQGAYEHGVVRLGEGVDADRAILGLAASFAAQGHWPEAEREFTRVLGRTAGEAITPYATLGLADVRYRQGDYAAAQPLYETLWGRWPAFLKLRPASLVRAMNNATLAGRPVEARRLALTFYNLYPRSPEAAQALVRVGDSFRQTGSRREAVLFYGEAIRRYPDAMGAFAARMRLAELGLEQMSKEQDHQLQYAVAALFHDGPSPNLDQAERAAVLRTVAEANSKQAAGSEALFHLGQHYEAADDLPQMMQAYGAAVARVGRIPDDPWPAAAGQRLSARITPLILQTLADQQDFKTVSLFQSLWGADNAVFADQDLIVKVAGVYRRLGFTPEAVRLYQGLLQSRQATPPLREEALYHLGQTYLDQKDFLAARQVFERYRLQHPLGRWRVEAHLALIQAYRGQEDYEGMVRSSRRWLQLYPTHQARLQVREGLAAALVSLGQTEEALRIYADLARVTAADGSPDPELLIHYADLLVQIKRYDDAVTRYWQALRASPDPRQADWIRLQLARVWRTQTHLNAAGKVLKDLNEQTADELLARFSASMQADLSGAGKKGGS